jgi:uncharacterized protein YkwD
MQADAAPRNRTGAYRPARATHQLQRTGRCYTGFMWRRPHRYAAPLAACALLACEDTYSQNPKVAAAYAAAAAGITVAQAVAAAHAPDTSGPDYSYAAANDVRPLREYALRTVNRIRADHALPPLTPSPSLTEFAQRGSEWLAEDHQPRRHLLSDARCTRCGENQGSTQGEAPGPPEAQIDAAIRRMMADDAEPRANLLSASWRFIGVGIVGPGDAMYFTIDFAEVAL